MGHGDHATEQHGHTEAETQLGETLAAGQSRAEEQVVRHDRGADQPQYQEPRTRRVGREQRAAQQLERRWAETPGGDEERDPHHGDEPAQHAGDGSRGTAVEQSARAERADRGQGRRRQARSQPGARDPAQDVAGLVGRAPQHHRPEHQRQHGEPAQAP